MKRITLAAVFVLFALPQSDTHAQGGKPPQLATDIASVDRRAVRRMLQTYDEASRLDGAGAWALEADVSNAWQGGGLDPARIEENRKAVVARGRTQL